MAAPRPRIGGYVIHGDNAVTLGACLQSLAAVCDEVVAVDSGSTDGSAELVRAAGAQAVAVPWRGYGASRQAAVEALGGCELLFYLDSDEWLEPAAQRALVERLHALDGAAPGLRLLRRNWAVDGQRRWLYGADWRFRVVRRALASWAPEMLVHEKLPPHPAPRVRIPIEHAFFDGGPRRGHKDFRYALLWALQHAGSSRRAGAELPRAAFRFLKDGVLKGAGLRGGLAGWRLAAQVARTHAARYRLLGEVRAGAYPELLALYRRGELGALFAAVAQLREPVVR
jgi:glycosyltransferase involved in cell wall biosynthesis